MNDRPFYVGYLKLPPQLRRFLLILAPAMILGAAAVGVAIVTRQRDPGDGSWNTSQLDTIEGVVVTAPYPMLLREGELILLVREGKHGFDRGGTGTLRGHWIARGGVRMFEVVNAELESTDEPDPPRTDLGPFQGRGQIVDPKCYLGAMKPGEGHVHKACATLCIRGGIPPMFLDEQTGELYLLTDAAGGPILDPILPYVADPVEVRGQAQRIANLKLLKLEADAIRRVR